MNGFKSISRIRKDAPSPRKFLRLHRAEFGHKFNKKISSTNLKHFYHPDVTGLLKKISLLHKLPSNFVNVGLGAESLIKDIFIWHSRKYKSRNVGFGIPTYDMYNVYAKIFDYKRSIFYYDPAKNHLLNYQYIVQFIKKNKLTLLILVNPSHPFEKSWSQNELKKIISFCKIRGVIVLLDEVYQGLVKSSGDHLTKKYHNLIVLRSFSKAFGLPGVRVGYTLAIKELNKSIETFRLSIEIPQSSIDAVLKILKNYRTVAKKRFEEIDKARSFARNQFKKRGLKSYNDNVNSVSVDLIKKEYAKLIGNNLKKNRIYVNYDYPNKLSKFINLTTTHTSNIKFFFKKFDSILKKKNFSF